MHCKYSYITTALNDIDNEWLRQWQDGSEYAFEQFYKKHLALLLKIACGKVRDFEAAREIVQEAFITFYEKKDRIEDNPSLYLKEILKYKILEFYKKRPKAQIVHLETAGNMPGKGHDSADHILDEKDAIARLSKSVAVLPTQQRKVFLLSREANKTNREIAEELGISVKAVEAHMTKALKYLRTRFDYHWLWLSLLFEMVK